MDQMQPDYGLCCQVQHHEPRVVKRMNHLCVYVTVAFHIQAIGERGVHNAGREVQQVENDKQQKKAARQRHRPGSERSLAIFVNGVRNRASPAVANGQSDREPDVKNRNQQQTDPRGPQKYGQLPENCRIGIERVRTLEYLKIPQHVKDDKTGKHQTRDGNNDFAAQ